MNGEETSEAALRLERLIPSPPETLFALWTDPAQLVRWWAPEGYEAAVQSLDVTPGGGWRVAMRSADGGVLTTSGVFRVVEPPGRLAFTWAWEDEHGARGHETEVVVRFEPTPGGTRLVLVQSRFETPRVRDNHTAGWSSCFDRMAKLVA
jgi:uncharacterized protein YndB with AHSA1/START domain